MRRATPLLRAALVPLIGLAVLGAASTAAAQDPVVLDDLMVREAPPGYRGAFDSGTGPIEAADFDDPPTYIQYGLEEGVPGWIRYFVKDGTDDFVLLYGWTAPDDNSATTIFGLVDVARNFAQRGAAFPVPEIEGVRTGLSSQGTATVLFRVGNDVFAAMGTEQAATVDLAVRQHAAAVAPPSTTSTTVAESDDEEAAPAAPADDEDGDDGIPVLAIPAALLVVGAGAGAFTVARRRSSTS